MSDTKQKIIVESLILFKRYGIKIITMDKLAVKLAVSKRTIYEIFKDKNELVEYCINHLITEEEEITKNIIDNSDNVIDGFLKRMRRTVNLMSSVNENFLYDAEKYHYSVFQRKGKLQNDKEYQMIIDFIQRGKKDGMLRNDINEEIISRLIKEQMKIVANVDLFPPDSFDKADVFRNISINFIRGIATQTGIEIIEKLKT